MNDTVESAMPAIDSVGVRVRILIAVITVIPIENIHASIWSHLLSHWHEPNVIGCEEVRLTKAFVRRTRTFHSIAIETPSVNVPHVEFVAILFGIRWRVEIFDAAIRCHLMLMFDDGVREPSVRWIRTTLSKIIGRLR